MVLARQPPPGSQPDGSSQDNQAEAKQRKADF
jgi:hypothetical protein